MGIITWNDNYSVGIKSIDEQHQKLVQYLQDLDIAIVQKNEKVILHKILHDLYEYIDFHFQTEEKYFRSVNYPETEQHLIEHVNFMRKVNEFVQDYESGNTDISIEIMSFLVDWLINHICGTDRKYSRYLIDHGIV